MNKEEIKLERWSVCNRYKNYKSINMYKEPVQFRPHPENVVRDVIMYHIYHNEGNLCTDHLIQHIKNKIINDLNEIFMLYEYAPDAIKTINRLMSSKRHLGTEDTYNETISHALTIKDARDVLIEQLSNVLIKCIPEPLGNVNFDIMKDENMNNNTTESSNEEDIRNDREVRIENREKEFLNCKSETEKAMLFPTRDLARLAVSDIITDAVERYKNEHDLVFKAKLKGEMKNISKETIATGFIFLAVGHIEQTFIVNDDDVKLIEKSVEDILDDSLNIPTRERGIDYITNIIWYSFYDTYFKNVLAFPKPVEESSTDTTDKSFDFAVKSASVKLYNHVYNIVDDLISKSCNRVTDMITNSRTFRMIPENEYDKYKILVLGKTIGYALHLSFGIDRGAAWNESNNALIDQFQFRHYLDPMVNQVFIHHMATFVCHNLSFDKAMELEKEALQHDQEIEKLKSDTKGNDQHNNWAVNELHKAMDEETTKMNRPANHEDDKEQENQRFQVGDLVSFEDEGWYYQSLIHGVCYNKDLKRWSYVIVAIDDFRCITGIEANRLTLLKKAKNI